jgi:hypothetical protein
MSRTPRKLVYLAVAMAAVIVVAAAARVALAQNSPPPGPTWYLCDINGDLRVDADDLALFREAWRKQHDQQQNDAAADFNVSGKVDHADAQSMVEYLINAEAAAKTQAKR